MVKDAGIGELKEFCSEHPSSYLDPAVNIVLCWLITRPTISQLYHDIIRHNVAKTFFLFHTKSLF